MGRIHHALRAAGANGLGTAAYRDEVLADSPVFYYRLADGAGATVAADEVGTQDGTIHGSPDLTVSSPLTTGLTACDLDGTNDYIDSGYTDDPTGAITVEVWWKSPASIAATNQRIMSKDRAGVQGSWLFRVADTGEFDWKVASGGYVPGTTAFAAGSASPSTLYHFVAVYDGATDRYELWVNGSLAGSRSSIGTMINSSTQPVVIGAESQGTGRYLEGIVAEAAYYEHALSPERIAAHYSSGI